MIHWKSGKLTFKDGTFCDNSFQLLTDFAKAPIVDVWVGSDYASISNIFIIFLNYPLWIRFLRKLYFPSKPGTCEIANIYSDKNLCT